LGKNPCKYKKSESARGKMKAHKKPMDKSIGFSWFILGLSIS